MSACSEIASASRRDNGSGKSATKLLRDEQRHDYKKSSNHCDLFRNVAAGIRHEQHRARHGGGPARIAVGSRSDLLNPSTQSGQGRYASPAFGKDTPMTTDNLSRNTPDRMDLPFVGLTTFARQPACPDWDKLDGADVAILGIPIDTASSYRVGTRFGPRAIREASMFHAFGPDGVFDFEDEVTYLTANEVKIVDAGDSDVIYADTKRSLANAEQAVRALLDAKTLPYILGGDHAITMATIAAFSNEKPIHIVHLDAHFDFIDERNGISWGHGSPMRRASEMAHVKGITTLGPHNMASVSRKDWEAAKAYGTHVVPLRKVRAQGAAASLAHIPDGERVYVSIDIDSFDPAIAPGTATISHGGFTYYEGKDILREVAKRFDVVGADFVEVSPPYDPSGITSLLAARTSLDLIGSIFHERAKRRA
jgi:agmatinase